ncbi:MAG: hypothetical protein M1820_002053 [Bogoriella megaspora]|nr:MAG: hypothetical protein M1820_002053 [Bogoriella megaspora]
MSTFNENLPERMKGKPPKQGKSFSGSSFGKEHTVTEQADVAIRNYVNVAAQIPFDPPSAWLSMPEVPTASEILPGSRTIQRQDSERAKRLPAKGLTPNKASGAWDSTDDYLRDQYNLIREDAVRPLRDAVGLFRGNRNANEVDFQNSVGIYDRAYVKGVTFSSRGIAIRLAFSTSRAEKRIRWDMSKRLLTGSLVALTPEQNAFSTKCILATVAARPLESLQMRPPQIDLYFANPQDINIDTLQHYTMVEGRGGFFEAHRWTMTALQHMSQESFPLQQHIVAAEPKVDPPSDLVGDRCLMNLSSVLGNAVDATKQKQKLPVQASYKFDVLKSWPEADHDLFDPTQQDAIRRMTTKSLAVIQGPPGTGKTYVSVATIKALLANMSENDPPIIIACQTNHALDQIMHQVAEFEPKFARMGGFSKDPIVKDRSIYELRLQYRNIRVKNDPRSKAGKEMKSITGGTPFDLKHLSSDQPCIDVLQLFQKGIISESQYNNFLKGANEWVQGGAKMETPMQLWLGKGLVKTSRHQPSIFDIFEEEDPEMELEDIKAGEAENVAKEDEEMDSLWGTYIEVDHSTTGKAVTLPTQQAEEILDKMSRATDFWDIPIDYRGTLYCHWLGKYKELMSEALQTAEEACILPIARRRVGYMERDYLILKRQRVIGMTTTGLSKYRAINVALKPRIVLIEEAGESLEGSVTSACVPSLQQLILVGDHQQLRPQTHVQLHGASLNMNLSLFERLINNKIEFTMLTEQRRMIPEIRRLLHPIYKDMLTDHPVVLSKDARPDVLGMGEVNTYFFNHSWSETKDADLSFVNQIEAEMVVGLFNYLCQAGEGSKKITVLTFYNGQRKEITRRIRKLPGFRNGGDARKLEVRTVDSYQGEEKDIIILSLARNNNRREIGFLSNANRICVAMSRARRGLYIFGNWELLAGKSSDWKGILEIMGGGGYGKKADMPKELESRIGDMLPIACEEHRTWTMLVHPHDWTKLKGGACQNPCGRVIEKCGHQCALECHFHDSCVCGKCPHRTVPAIRTWNGSYASPDPATLTATPVSPSPAAKFRPRPSILPSMDEEDFSLGPAISTTAPPARSMGATFLPKASALPSMDEEYPSLGSAVHTKSPLGPSLAEMLGPTFSAVREYPSLGSPVRATAPTGPSMAATLRPNRSKPSTPPPMTAAFPPLTPVARSSASTRPSTAATLRAKPSNAPSLDTALPSPTPAARNLASTRPSPAVTLRAKPSKAPSIDAALSSPTPAVRTAAHKRPSKAGTLRITTPPAPSLDAAFPALTPTVATTAPPFAPATPVPTDEEEDLISFSDND